jgi:hypothetical protein
MAARALTLDAVLHLEPVPPEKLLPIFVKNCQDTGTSAPQWNWRSRFPERDFVLGIEQAVAPWMPAHHEDFISAVTGKGINIENLGDRMKATKSLIWKSLNIKTVKDDSTFDPTVLKTYPVKALPNDEEDEENPGNSSPKKRRRRKDELPSTEGDEDMTAKKTTAKKGAAPKAKTHPKGAKGQLTPIGKKDWSKLPDEKKLTQGEAPRQLNSPLGKVYALLPAGKATITVGTLLKNTTSKLRFPEKKARAVIYKLVNRYHAKLA